MKYFLKTKELIVKDNEIKNEEVLEVLNLIEEKEKIKKGTRVVINKNYSIEAIEVDEDKAVWEVV